MPIVAVVRSGCTDFDEQDRIQGTLELPLNQRGRDQLQQIVEAVGMLPVSVLYTEPVDPARSTAEAIGEQLDLPVRESEELRNMSHGLWQGLSIEEVRRKSPRIFRHWLDSPETIRPPEGEMVSEVMERIVRVLRRPLKRGTSFAVVTREPLASLVGCVITGSRPELERVAGCSRADELVAVYETNGNVPALDPRQPWRTEPAAGCRQPTAGKNDRGTDRGA